jgi:hypothetical protein
MTPGTSARDAAPPALDLDKRDLTLVLGRTTAARARQADLSEHAARLMAVGASGELVLIDEATGDDPYPPTDDTPPSLDEA